MFALNLVAKSLKANILIFGESTYKELEEGVVMGILTPHDFNVSCLVLE